MPCRISLDQFPIKNLTRDGLSPVCRFPLLLQKTLGRLHRSLVKIKNLDPRVHFDEGNWEALLDGYFSESRSA